MKVLETLTNYAAEIIFFIILIILIAIILYSFLDYAYFSKKINNIAPKVNGEVNGEVNSNSITTSEVKISHHKKNKITYETEFKLMILIRQSIILLKYNANIIYKLNFYDKKINEFIENNKWYLEIFKLMQFIDINKSITIEHVNESIEKLYGSQNSLDLFVNIDGVNYYLPIQFKYAMNLYQVNKYYIDQLIQDKADKDIYSIIV